MSVAYILAGALAILVAIILIVFVATDAEIGDVASFVTSISIGVVVGVLAMFSAIIAELGGLIGEFPGWAVALIASTLGALSLEGLIDWSPQMFALAVLITAIVAIAIREG